MIGYSIQLHLMIFVARLRIKKRTESWNTGFKHRSVNLVQ